MISICFAIVLIGIAVLALGLVSLTLSQDRTALACLLLGLLAFWSAFCINVGDKYVVCEPVKQESTGGTIR